ncbi:DUF5906 domain-containing protein [Chromobacterium sp. S0633]|uniref:DUF5906 domain-containing protein n=1 Tax=Chromobacterium sp. S0633 TaxID=2957805 RepID=UPI00209D6ADB|nr:DUF5906 domain-containing protein [Chromobacterium sp. S0633]MCP1290918.1 DUF5906 domain-containing protein [Chromobacterium sp. S0633]
MGALLDSVLDQFRERGMPDIGITDLRADDKKHVYGPKKKAWYRLNEYHSPKTGKVWLSGVFGHKDEWWKIEHQADGEVMTPEEREAAQREFERKEREYQARQRRVYELASNRARAQWERSVKDGESAYCVRKQIARAESARYMTDHGWENWLIIPLIRYDQSRLVGVQKIAPEKPADGVDKRFTKGFEKNGAACRLGDEPIDGDLLLVAEGYATATSGREAVEYDYPVFMALDSGNLPHVARILRAKYPNSPLLFLADDDYLPKKSGEPNHAGEKKAQQAVLEVGNAAFVLPRFSVARRASDDDESLPKLTDFNDLHDAEGIEVARAQIRAAINAQLSPPPLEEVPNGDSAATVVDNPEGGEGPPQADIEAELYKHFALVEGKTRAIDKRSGVEYSKAALKDRYGKDAVEAWLARDNKLLMTQAEVSAMKRMREQKERRTDIELIENLKRYIYLDGSSNIWDEQLRRVIDQASAKLAMGSYFKVWLDDPNRRKLPFDAIRFEPGRDLGPDYINLYRGLPLVPARPAGELPRDLWALVPRFPACENIIVLLHHLCNWRSEVVEWMINWIAYPLQNIGAKMDSAILMHGDIHGSGKSMFWELCVKPLYGEYGTTLGQHQLESQYTSSRSRRLFILFEEVFASNQKYSHTGVLKHMITGKTQTIEKKFVDSWEEENHLNAVFLSNAIQPFHVEAHDRRYMVLWPGEKLPDELKTAVSYELGNGGLEAFYGFLMSVPLTLAAGREPDGIEKFDPHTQPMMTPEKSRLIRYGLSGWELFYSEWLRGDLPVPFLSCMADDLVAVYHVWCARSGEKEMSRNKFVNAMATKVPKARRRWRWKGMADSRQDQIFKVGREGMGLAEMDYLGDHISQFRHAMRDAEISLPDDL